MERYDIEELVLGLADIVRENRYLRQENTRLREVEKEYHQSIIDRCRESEQASLNMFKAACVGIAQGKNDMELARDLVEHLQQTKFAFQRKGKKTMNEYIKEIEQIAAKCTESQSDGYSQIMRICDAMREQQKSCLGYISKEEIASPQFDQT